MSLRAHAFAEALTRLREQHVAALLERIATLIDLGAEVTPEPWLRDADGDLRRSAILRLPARADLAATRAGRALPPPAPDMQAGAAPIALTAFPAGEIMLQDDMPLTLQPFRWQAALLTLDAPGRVPDWTPLRRWALEWMQAHHGAEAPELLGALHALGDPRQEGAQFLLSVDFGSAPPRAVSELAEALAHAGADRVALGPQT